MKRILIAIITILSISTIAKAQLRKIPSSVTGAFKTKFASADKLEWNDRIINFEATFSQNGVAKSAKFTKEGIWLETTSTITLNALPTMVIDGFKKSKYADLEVKGVSILEQAGKQTLYKLYVRKDDIQKRNLFFDKNGKLIKDNLTV